jgi:hypothetical protein
VYNLRRLSIRSQNKRIVRNVKFGKNTEVTFWSTRNNTSCSHSNLALMLSSSLHCKECLSGQFARLNPLYNRALLGNWPHSLTCYLRALNIEDCFIRGDGSELDIYKKLPLSVQNLFGFRLYKVSRDECIWIFVLPLVNCTSTGATLVNVNWLLIFLSKF